MKKLTLSLAALLVIGCKPNNVGETKPDFVPTPTALSFNACPTRDENNLPVSDVFPDVKKLTISNQGKVRSN